MKIKMYIQSCTAIWCCAAYNFAVFRVRLLSQNWSTWPTAAKKILWFRQLCSLSNSKQPCRSVHHSHKLLRTVLPAAIIMMTVTIAIIVTGISNGNSDNSDSSSNNNRHVKLEKRSGCMKSHLLQTTILSVKRLIAFVSTVQHHLNRTGSNQ